LGDAQIPERFLERLTGMGVGKEQGGFHGGFSGMLRLRKTRHAYAPRGWENFRVFPQRGGSMNPAADAKTLSPPDR
jgi:hypothetical protein